MVYFIYVVLRLAKKLLKPLVCIYFFSNFVWVVVLLKFLKIFSWWVKIWRIVFYFKNLTENVFVSKFVLFLQYNNCFMKIVQKELELGRLDYYGLHLSLVNCFLPKKLTNKEIEILSGFMSLDVEESDRFNASSRKEVFERLGKTLKTNISNYLSSMLKKGVLVKENGIFSISMFMFPDRFMQGYQFKIINNG